MAKQNSKGKWVGRVQFTRSGSAARKGAKRKDDRKTFPTKSAAEKWERKKRKGVRKVGTDSLLSADETSEYRQAKALARGEDLREVCRDWAQRHPVAESLLVSEAIRRFMTSKEWERYADKTVSDYRSKLKQFKEAFGGYALDKVHYESIQRYVDCIPNVITRNGHIRFLKRFFRWCMLRDLVQNTPTERLEQEPEDGTTPEFIPLEDVLRLLMEATRTDTGLIPYLVLGYFAGIRTCEILRMEKRDFLMEDKRINIRPEVAKRKRKGRPLPRLIEGLPDTLWLWLQAVGFDGTLDKANISPRVRRLAKRAGVKWIHSAARHTFCTYAYAWLQDAGKVRKWTGHRNNDTVFLRHYAGLEIQSRGEKYFKILPPSETIEPKRQTLDGRKGKPWPCDKALLAWAASTPKTQIAKELGYTEAAVRKRLKAISNRLQ